MDAEIVDVPRSGDMAPCRMTGVSLRGVMFPEGRVAEHRTTLDERLESQKEDEKDIKIMSLCGSYPTEAHNVPARPTAEFYLRAVVERVCNK